MPFSFVVHVFSHMLHTMTITPMLHESECMRVLTTPCSSELAPAPAFSSYSWQRSLSSLLKQTSNLVVVIGPISDISRAFSELHDFSDLDVSKPIWEFESGPWNVQISESNFLIDFNRWKTFLQLVEEPDCDHYFEITP